MKGSEETRSDGSFQCEICDKKFMKKQILNKHIASIHEEKKPNQCNICDYTLRRQKSV